MSVPDLFEDGKCHNGYRGMLMQLGDLSTVIRGVV